MKLTDLLDRKFLGKEDVERPYVGVIENFTRDDLKRDDGSIENKGILHVRGIKPIVLNPTNIGILQALYGNETDDAIGKQIEVYNDPYVSFRGKITGGVRLRAPGAGVPAPTAAELYPQGNVPQAAPPQPAQPWGSDTPPLQYTEAVIKNVNETTHEGAPAIGFNTETGAGYMSLDPVVAANARTLLSSGEKCEISWVHDPKLGNKAVGLRKLTDEQEQIPV